MVIEQDYGAVQMRMKNGATMRVILPEEDKNVDDMLSPPAILS